MSTTIDRLAAPADPADPAVDDAADTALTPDPAHRLRRTRRTEALRAFVRETRIHPRQLVAPLFVFPGAGRREPVGSMPGVERVTPDEALPRRAPAPGASASAA